MRIKRLDSTSNSIYKELLTLTTSKGINKSKKAFICGDKIIHERLSLIEDGDFFVFHSEHHPLFESTPDQQVIVVTKDMFKELDVVGTNAPLLCKTITPLKNENTLTTTPQEHELLCALGDPNNLGAVIRSAYAFGIKKMILLEECANPYLPKVTKAASGYNYDMVFEKGPSIKALQSVTNLAALDMSGESIHTADLKIPKRWLLGEEGQGIPKDFNGLRISIPMNTQVESLNAAVSASILFFAINAHQQS